MQKAKTDWIKFGDANTKYFHVRVARRKNKLKIVRLKDEHGNWCEDQSTLQSQAVAFFQKLYSKDIGPLPSHPIKGAFPTLCDEDYLRLVRPVESTEVYDALFEMKPLKALGLDGLRALFFQSQWATVGQSLVQYVSHVMEGRDIGDNICSSLIVLIPKISTP